MPCRARDAINTAKAFKEALPLTGIILTKTGRRFARRRGAVGAPGHRRADQVRRHESKRSTAWKCSMPNAMPAACWAWATSSRWSSRSRRRRRGGGAEARRQGARAAAGFDLNDFLGAAQPDEADGRALASLMDKLPTQMAAKAGRTPTWTRAERDVRRKEGIIQSMTPLERRKPELLKATPQAPHRGRRRRAGSGSEPPAQSSSSRCRE
jgi:signal recognition particle subunit SRP54